MQVFKNLRNNKTPAQQGLERSFAESFLSRRDYLADDAEP